MTLTPKELSGRELTNTEAYRTMIRYQVSDWTFRTSWVRDVIDYAKGDYASLDRAVTDKFSNRIEKDFFWTLASEAHVEIKAGAEYMHYRASVDGYDSPNVSENRGDIFILSRLQATQRLLVSANLRQAFVTRYNPPFTPSLGVEYALLQNTQYHLKLKGSYSRSYRVPTLNERYWKDLGNPNIKPETGWNKEIGLEQHYKLSGKQTVTASIAAYHNRVKDWTYWNPSQNYQVENLQQVLAKGIEIQAGFASTFGVWKSGGNLGYAFNKSAQEKIYDSYSSDIIGKQLVFVPIHSGNFNGFVQYRQARITGQIQSNSKRFTTFDNSQFIKGYTLANVIVENTIMWGQASLCIRGQINNVSNTFYLNIRNNAMPGRSYAVSLIVSRHSPKS